jgi:SsrA-binding protein
MKSFMNRKASHEYYFIEDFEAGIVLKGTEIKSLRAGRLSFKDSFATIKEGEVWLLNLHISPYDKEAHFNHEPERKRKLLLNKREIRKLTRKVEEQGMTIVPKSVYINAKGLAKVKISLAKGKHNYDKREVLMKKDQQRDLDRRIKYN